MEDGDLWFRIAQAWSQIEVTEDVSPALTNDPGVRASELLKAAAPHSGILFVGNGGSQAIAAHAAADFHRHLGLYCDTPSNIAFLTAATNDYSYADAFGRWIGSASRPGSILVAISSSGQSPNILLAATRAKEMGLSVLTLSGFKPDNPLRDLGDVNLYVPSTQYQVVEAVHHIWLCDLLERTCGYAI